MREIKFRAWDREFKRMIDDFLDYSIQMARGELASGGYIEGGIMNVWEESRLPSQPFIVMQSTGLKDKNGIEIYEGDIVEWDDNSDGKWRRRCRVVYIPAHYRLVGYYYDIAKPKIHNPIEFDCGAFAYERKTEKELEVIGNVYKNPELLTS